MSEWIYACLLRLYPARFRKQYGEEALQLFRDRWRDEAGFVRRCRLCLDLVLDGSVGLRQAYRNSSATAAPAAIAPASGAAPLFRMLEKEPLGPGVILLGGVLSLGAIAAFASMMSHAIADRSEPDPRAASSPIERVLQRVNQAASPDSTHDPKSESSAAASQGSTGTKSDSKAASPPASLPGSIVAAKQPDRDASFVVRAKTRPETSAANSARSAQALLASSTREAQSDRTAAALARASGQAVEIDAAERQRVIDAVAANLKAHYFDRAIAQKTADALLGHVKNGDDDEATSGEAFAAALTRQMRDASGDMHLVVEYSRGNIPENQPAQTAEDLIRYRNAMLQQNCMFTKVEMLPHNVGYFKLDSFPDTSVCEAKARVAMASLNHANAVIFDLRDNTGGYPDMVSFIAGYLFKHPEFMYNPRGGDDAKSWTRSPIPGNQLADKPVYVLTSSATWSGAEQFSYDLEMLKRATLVGETTRGGTHAGAFHRIDDHFGMGIPEQRVVNPYGKADWEGIGVEPDVKVPAADALVTAEKLAEGQLKRRSPRP